MFIGGSSVFFLLSILHFWYGMSRYPSIWNRFVSAGLKGLKLDRNFKEIKEICGYHHNGHNRMNSQILPFVITLPFTILFHAIAFLNTAFFSLLKISRVEELGAKLPDPVITSIFLSNTLVTSLWFLGGTGGIVFATLTVFFNQKAFNSLLFKKSFKDFFISLMFGNLLIVQDKTTSSVIEIPLSEKSASFDLEEGIQVPKIQTRPKLDEGIQYSPASLPPVRYLPPLLGASTSSSTNSLVDQGMPTPENYSSATPRSYASVTNEEINAVEKENDKKKVATDDKLEPSTDSFVDETASQQTEEVLQHIVSVESTQQNPGGITCDENVQKPEEIIRDENTQKAGHIIEDDIKTTNAKTIEPAKKLPNKGLRGLSRRFFSTSMSRFGHSKEYNFHQRVDQDEISVEFLDPSDVHLDMENHPGTLEWRNTISEAIQKFKIKTYTLRKHNWVMGKMHGKSFYVRDSRNRRRKLKRKEIKDCCKDFHDKQVHVNAQIFGILDDLKDLRKNISHSKSNSVSHSRSTSEHTRFSFTNLPSKVNEKTLPSAFGSGQAKKNKKVYAMRDEKDKTPKFDAASVAKESHVGSKDSSISTLTESFIYSEQRDDNRSGLCMNELTGKILQPNDDSSSFKDAIDGLLKCTPWVENINALRQNAPKEENGNKQNFSTDAQNNPPENCMLESGKKSQYEGWPIDFDFPEMCTQECSGKQQEREDRLRSKETALKQIEPVVAQLQHEPETRRAEENNLNRASGEDGREMNIDDGFVSYSQSRSTLVSFSQSKSSLRSDSSYDSEIDESPAHSVYKKITSMNFARECSPFDGMADTCSQLNEIEEREDEESLSDIKVMSTDRV